MKKQVLLGLAVGAAALGAGVFAGDQQEGPKPQMFCIYEEVVTPSKVKDYEASIKYMINEFKAYDIDPEKVNFKAVSGPEIGYLYMVPLENFAGMDRMHENFEAAIEVIGRDKFRDMTAAAEAAIDHVDIFHVMRRPDLSYAPENPSLKPDEVQYVHYSFYYAIQGKKEALEELARQYIELYKRKNIDTGWTVYESITGTDLPLYVVAHAARSPGDFYRQRDENTALMGAEGEELGQKVLSVIRKVEFKEAWPRPDLSYPEPEAAASPSAR